MHFFTSAVGESGGNSIHPEVLSGDLRKEMELQSMSITHVCSFITGYCFCSFCQSRHADRIWDTVRNRIWKELYFAGKGRKCTWLFCSHVLYSSLEARYIIEIDTLWGDYQMYSYYMWLAGWNVLFSGDVNQLLLAYKVFLSIIPSFVDYLMTIQLPYPFPPNPEVSSLVKNCSTTILENFVCKLNRLILMVAKTSL